VPAAGVIVCSTLIYTLPWQTLELAVVWLVIGLGIYFTYSRNHSRLAKG
jgi:APA family basic amino acid/polyamine antiporter